MTLSELTIFNLIVFILLLIIRFFINFRQNKRLFNANLIPAFILLLITLYANYYKNMELSYYAILIYLLIDAIFEFFVFITNSIKTKSK
jgi:hypothetical protein